MAQRFSAEPCDASIFENAPARYAAAFAIARPAADVWNELTADGALAFCRMLGGAEWTSPRPFGTGTTRTMRVGFGALVIEEYFFRWDEGRRKSFCVTSSSLPLFKRFAEDYLVEETSAGSCRFTWTLAGEPTLLGRLGTPLNAALMASLFADTRRHFNAR